MFFKDKEEYENYLKKNGIYESYDEIGRYFNWTNNGEIILKECKRERSALDINRYTNCESWYILKDNETMALVKHPFGDIRRDLNINDYYTTIYNNILLPQIAHQFQNDSAIYYIATEKEYKTQSYYKKYILTVDFKRKHEKMKHGEEILEEVHNDICELNVDKLINAIEKYLNKYNFSKLDIERVRQDFIKQSFFNRFIKQCDENNHNWGILVNTHTHSVRMSPLYDMECSCEINVPTRHCRKTNDGSMNSLEHFMNQYKNEEWFGLYMKQILDNFNLEEAFEKSKQETKTDIPEEYKERYRNFFGVRFYEFKNAYEKVYKRKDKEVIVQTK